MQHPYRPFSTSKMAVFTATDLMRSLQVREKFSGGSENISDGSQDRTVSGSARAPKKTPRVLARGVLSLQPMSAVLVALLPGFYMLLVAAAAAAGALALAAVAPGLTALAGLASLAGNLALLVIVHGAETTLAVLIGHCFSPIRDAGMERVCQNSCAIECWHCKCVGRRFKTRFENRQRAHPQGTSLCLLFSTRFVVAAVSHTPVLPPSAFA
jgi:hypothetical protein